MNNERSLAKEITEGFEALKSMRNNEPVAWAREDGVIAFHKQKEVDSQGFKWFPLYTHPVKELTDEELFKVYADLEEAYTGNNFPVDLGRAILRKAQEK